MGWMMLFTSGQKVNLYSKWSFDIICLLIFLMSIAIRLVKLVFEPLLLRDGTFYLRMAEIWHQTGDYLEITKEASNVPPLPLWCIKTLMNFYGNPEIAGRSISIFLGGANSRNWFYFGKNDNTQYPVFTHCGIVFYSPAGSIPRCLRRVRIENVFASGSFPSRVRSGVIP